MRFFSSLVRPDESTGAVMRWVHRIWVFFWLTVLGAGIGLLSLYLTAHSYASIDATALLQSYFKIPLLVAMNLLAPILLVYLGFFLFVRPWAAYLLSALPFFTLALASYYKVQLRGDPVLATDLRLIRTAGGIMGNYTFEISAPVIVVLEGFVLMLVLSCLMLRKERMSPRSRLAGIMLMLSVTLACYFELYTSSSIYKETANNDLISPWSAVEVYISRGTTYPFLHSVQDMFPEPPEGYRESEAKQILEQYADTDIPDDQKITVVGIMLEAFSDLSDFPQLNEISAVRNLYEPLHELESRSVSGNLLTNIFAGGTTNTEWGFLTGYSQHEEFRGPINSYVRYFKDQGYDALYRHPGYSWFYNRSNVNEYLGFDECVFNESGFGDLISIEDALFKSDTVLVDYLLNDIDSRTEDDDPLFLFSVSYQNHGPYSSETYWEEYVTPAKTGWSMESCCVINNYLAGIRSTIEQMRRLTRELEARDEPIVLVLFGDHKPWRRRRHFPVLPDGQALLRVRLDGRRLHAAPARDARRHAADARGRLPHGRRFHHARRAPRRRRDLPQVPLRAVLPRAALYFRVIKRRIAMKSFKITALSLVLVLLLAACGAKNDTPDEPAVDPTPEPPIEQPVEKTPDERINDIIAGMNLEEKVGQLFFVRCPETGAAEDVETYHLGGLLLFGRDYKDANGDWLTEDDFTAALASYQAAAAIPLFIGSDEEGGTVTRASKNPNLFSEPLPSPQELYAAGGLDGLLERTLSYNQKLKAFGVNVNFAPVCDVSTNPDNFIYARSFGQDAQTTANYISSVVPVYAQSGVACVLKHFPGYGNNADTHTGIALDARPYTTFEKSDLVPFESGIAAGAPFVLVSHNIVECMDGAYPASLSAKVHTLLRDTLGFTGVIVTDDLAMDAVKAYAQDGSAAVLAIQAGNDMIVTTDYQTQIPQVIAAVQSGEIAESDIDAHVFRVLHEKQALGLID